jgi:hypothetical protein
MYEEPDPTISIKCDEGHSRVVVNRSGAVSPIGHYLVEVLVAGRFDRNRPIATAEILL